MLQLVLKLLVVHYRLTINKTILFLSLKTMYKFLLIVLLYQGFQNFVLKAPFKEIKKAMASSYKINQKTLHKNT